MPDPNIPDTGDTGGGSDYGPYAPGQGEQNFTAPAPAAPQDSWSSRAYHGVLSALGGKYDTQYIPTENGVVATQVANTPGQQWKRIISGALTGLAGAEAAGTQGPGGIARGLGGGIQAGYGERIRQDQQDQKQANVQFEQQRQVSMDKANRSMMNIELAQKTFALKQGEKEATVADIERSNQYHQLIHEGGADSRSIGHYATPDDVYAATQKDPSLHVDLAHGRIIVMPHIENGKISGVDGAYVSDNWLNTPTTDDIPVSYKITGPDGKLMDVHHTIPAGAVKQGQAMDVLNRLSTMQMEDHWKEIEADFKKKELGVQQGHLAVAQAAEKREAAQAPLNEQYKQAQITALQNKDPYNEPPQAQGTFDPKFPPLQNYARGTPGIDVGKKIKGLDANEEKVELLSNNIVSNADEVKQILAKAYPQLSGPVEGRVTRFKQWLGTDDPNISKVQAFIHQLAMATVGIHGSRSKGNVDETEDVLMRDFVNGPKSVTGAVDANVHSAQNFLDQIQNIRQYGTPNGPDRSRQIIYGGTGQPMANQQQGAGGNTGGGQQQQVTISPSKLPVMTSPPADALVVREGDTSYYFDKNGTAIGKSK